MKPPSNNEQPRRTISCACRSVLKVRLCEAVFLESVYWYMCSEFEQVLVWTFVWQWVWLGGGAEGRGEVRFVSTVCVVDVCVCSWHCGSLNLGFACTVSPELDGIVSKESVIWHRGPIAACVVVRMYDEESRTPELVEHFRRIRWVVANKQFRLLRKEVRGQGSAPFLVSPLRRFVSVSANLTSTTVSQISLWPQCPQISLWIVYVERKMHNRKATKLASYRHIPCAIVGSGQMGSSMHGSGVWAMCLLKSMHHDFPMWDTWVI